MNKNDSQVVDLDTVLQRGEQTISAITLRKPKSGELRGIALTDLMRMEVTALQTVLPRISEPTLTSHDVAQMDPADLAQCGIAVAGFLLPKAERLDSPTK
ncbi:phage tail assembly protein [Silvimonas sp.]|uniref:phage tail assembly protein n=1 Tax=Silvimonas sp. TaxID=2650811 RepID=UPI00285106C1|nr:phage tail assembly protein [Silvimonas sp.]MDR3429012.1 phage tail assembly protein [Silvimonas sp.]